MHVTRINGNSFFCKTTLALHAIAEIRISSCFLCIPRPIAIIIGVWICMRNTLIFCFVSNLILISIYDFQKSALYLDCILVFLMFLHWLMVPMCTSELSTFPSYQKLGLFKYPSARISKSIIHGVLM